MNGSSKLISAPFFALIVTIIVTLSCNGTPTPTQPPGTTAQDCHGDLFVAQTTVSKVTPAPKQTYQKNQTYTWGVPYGIQVTGSGRATLRVYDALNRLLSEYNVYATTATTSQIAVEEWNGTKTVTFNAGNYLIRDNGGQAECSLNLIALGVGITSLSTEYLLTVRPDRNEVIVVILEGAVEITSQGRSVTLDFQDPDARLGIVRDGEIEPPQPVDDPEALLENVMEGGDIEVELAGETPPGPESMRMWADDRLAPILEELGAQYEQDTGIRLELEAFPQGEIVDRFAAAASAGTGPDLLTVDHFQAFDLISNELLVPLEPGADPDELVPGTIQAFRYRGNVYAAPYVYSNLALISNPVYADDIPPTWSELAKFTAELSFGREFFTGLMIPYDGYHFYPVQSAFGGYIFGPLPDGGFDAGDFGLDGEGSLRAAVWLEEFANTQATFLGDEQAALDNFVEGMAAMTVTGPWSLPRLREAGAEYIIHSFPQEVQESRPYLSVSGFAISRASSYPEFAQQFILEYLTRPEVQRAYSGILEIPPAHRRALEALEDRDVREFGIAGLQGVPIPSIPEMGEVWGPWGEAVQAVMSGELSAEEAFVGSAQQVRQRIGQ